MGLFDRFISKQTELGYTTKKFYLGSPEAEGEIGHSSKINLGAVFEDYLNVLPELQHEKFIITGRKGSGKTAIGEYIYSLSEKEHDYFCDFIRKSDINIEKIVQIGQETGHPITKELLFEWIILIRMIKCFTNNQALLKLKEIKDLQTFLKKNSGFVDIKEHQITEILRSQGFEVNTEYFKRFLQFKFGNKYDIKQEKAPFYKLIPHLRDTVQAILESKEGKTSKYILIFDDLDIGFYSEDAATVDTLCQLLRIVKEYNRNFFDRRGVDAKIIVLLRDDIAKFIEVADADMAKIFSSYQIELKWFEQEIYFHNESLTKLKQFINKRIEKNFEKKNIAYSKKDPWLTLIPNDQNSYRHSSFKYVVDHTFYRPRDLLLFFKPISDFEFRIPLSKQDVNKLIGKYVKDLFKEIDNELSASFDKKSKGIIVKSLSKYHDGQQFTFKDLKNTLGEYDYDGDINKAIESMFEYSLIGYKDPNNNMTYFRHWEKEIDIINLKPECELLLHFALRIYFTNNPETQA